MAVLQVINDALTGILFAVSAFLAWLCLHHCSSRREWDLLYLKHDLKQIYSDG